MEVVIKEDKQSQIKFITVIQPHMEVTFTNFGARIHEWQVEDKDGVKENIVLTIDKPEDILSDTAQFGALVGPVAGRIKNADWNGISLEKNLGKHHIHGSNNGWWHQFWDVDIEETANSVFVHFSLKDTDSGYPGPIHVTNTYEVTKKAIAMTTTCQTDEETIVNPTNHVYFNLSGNAKEDISTHALEIPADYITETDEDNLPTGKLIPVAGTGYDFNQLTTIETNFNNLSSGLDDAFILSQSHPIIKLTHPESGRELTITTNRKAAVVFSMTDFNLDYCVNGKQVSSQLGLAIETQELPDIVHFPEWGSINLSKGDTRIYKTTYNIENT